MLRCFALLGVALAAHATTLLQMTPDQLTTASTGVVRGTVTGTYTAQTGRTIFTHYKVSVSEQWKGAWPATVDIAVPGGALNGVRQSYAGVPALQTGGEYVLFLWTGKSGMTQLTGFSQGAYAVSSDGNGNATASRPATGELMVGPQGQAVSDRAVSMLLSDMRTSVKNLAAAATPVSRGAVR